MDTSFRFFPDAASTIAPDVDNLYYTMISLCGGISIIIAITIIYFAAKYRRRPGFHPAQIKGSLPLELAWTLIPLCLFMCMFVWGSNIYIREDMPPADAMDIYVVGRQWMWKIQHPEGRREINEIHVPLGKPVRLITTSQDVIHDFFIPAFRIKRDVLPGRYMMEWFQAVKLGEYHFFCSQYCGTSHAVMRGKVIVMEPSKYADWLNDVPADESMVAAGARLFEKFKCNTCHGVKGPTLAGLYGRKVKLQDGRTVVADDNYLRQSILDPSAQIVAGYQNLMPTFRGQLSEEQLIELIEYIKSLKQYAAPEVHR